MKKLLLALVAAALIAPSASAQVRVNGYVKKDGTYVAPYYRSSPNGTKLDNYSTRGNYNPYTGKAGTKDPYSARSSTTSTYETHKPNPSSSNCTYCSSDDGDNDE